MLIITLSTVSVLMILRLLASCAPPCAVSRPLSAAHWHPVGAVGAASRAIVSPRDPLTILTADSTNRVNYIFFLLREGFSWNFLNWHTKLICIFVWIVNLYTGLAVKLLHANLQPRTQTDPQSMTSRATSWFLFSKIKAACTHTLQVKGWFQSVNNINGDL